MDIIQSRFASYFYCHDDKKQLIVRVPLKFTNVVIRVFIIRENLVATDVFSTSMFVSLLSRTVARELLMLEST